MENKYKIIVSYIQDMSVEIPNPESLITIRNTIPEYRMKVKINSKPSKRKMIEVLTTLSYENPNKKKAGGKVFRRGGGKALRGMGKATYSNKMY